MRLFRAKADDTREPGLESVWHRLQAFDLHARRARMRPEHEAPHVVMVHGLVVSSRYMTPLLQRMGPQFPAIAPDLPGFGRSDKPRHVLTIRQLADALAGWMQVAGIGKAVLLGNSLGCQIAVDCALRYPDRVTGLVLQGPTPDPSQRGFARMMAMNFLNGQRESGVGVGPLLDHLQAGPRRAYRTVQNLLADPIEDKLPRVEHPAMVLRGSKDTIVTQDWAEAATRLLPNGTLRVVPGAAHTMVAAAATEVSRIVKPFLLSLG